MALLFNDPLAFLPEQPVTETPVTSSGLRMLFQHWNNSANLGTFNHPQQSVVQQQQLEQLEEVNTRMDNLQQRPSDRSLHARRIRPQQQMQMVEPIPIMDLDHPLNSWMLNSNQEHQGPLATKNNSDWPILPRFTVSVLSNGTLVQIPVSLIVDNPLSFFF